MNFKFEDGLLLFAGFLLNGVVPFAIFLANGLIYGTGSGEEILVLIAAVTSGGFFYSLIGLGLAKITVKLWPVPIVLSILAITYASLSIYQDNILTLRTYGIYALLSMSPVMPASFLISGFARKVRGRAYSVGHFISMGAGSPAVFVSLFFFYVFLNYSRLPLISLLSEIFAFFVCGLILFSYERRYKDVPAGGAYDE